MFESYLIEMGCPEVCSKRMAFSSFFTVNHLSTIISFIYRRAMHSALKYELVARCSVSTKAEHDYRESKMTDLEERQPKLVQPC